VISLKKHLSVWALTARGTIYKALLLLLGMAGAEAIVFYLAMQHVLRWEYPTLEAAFTLSRIQWVCAAGFLLLSLLLSLHTCAFSAKTGYSLKRLSVSEHCVALWQTAWHMICYMLFWAVQVLLVLAFSQWYIHSIPTGFTGNQTVFLAFHRVEFLFGLMPMGLTTRWIRNILFLIAISFATACFSFRQRRGKLPLAAGVQAGLILFFFSISMTDSSADTLSMILTLGILFAAACTFLAKEDDPHEKAVS